MENVYYKKSMHRFQKDFSTKRNLFFISICPWTFCKPILVPIFQIYLICSFLSPWGPLVNSPLEDRCCAMCFMSSGRFLESPKSEGHINGWQERHCPEKPAQSGDEQDRCFLALGTMPHLQSNCRSRSLRTGTCSYSTPSSTSEVSISTLTEYKNKTWHTQGQELELQSWANLRRANWGSPITKEYGAHMLLSWLQNLLELKEEWKFIFNLIKLELLFQLAKISRF